MEDCELAMAVIKMNKITVLGLSEERSAIKIAAEIEFRINQENLRGWR